MLILERRAGDFIQIGAGVQVHVIEIGRGVIKLGITAPDDVLILRGPELVGRDGVQLEHDLRPPSERKR